MPETLLYCALWNKAKDLAETRGLQMSDNCPLARFCEGTACGIIESAEEKDRRETQEKLTVLRQEIRTFLG